MGQLTFGAVWLALSDHEEEGDFGWSNGEAVAFIKWPAGEPNNFAVGQDYVIMATASGEWDDTGEVDPTIFNGVEWVIGDIAIMTVIESD